MLIGLLIFICSILITYLLISISPLIGTIDKPNERRQNKVPVPSAGGLAILLTWYSGLVYIYFFRSIDTHLFYGLLSGLILVVIGLLDDIFEIKPVWRLIAQAVSTILGLYFIGGLSVLDFGFFVITNQWVLSIFAFIGIMWVINLFNFLDGIDGYAGMEIVFFVFFLYFFAGASYSLLLAAATAGFLVWNWPKAKIFMGDVGSTTIGFTIGLLMIHYQNTSQINLFVSLIAFALFWFDATYTLFKRWRNKEKLTLAHKKHVYQRMVQSGFSHQKTLLIGIGINMILLVLALGAYKKPEFMLLFFIGAVLLMYILARWVNKRKAF